MVSLCLLLVFADFGDRQGAIYSIMDDDAITCRFGTGEKFMVGDVNEGLASQRMALIGYMALASELHRTFVFSNVYTGNTILGAQIAIGVYHIYDVHDIREKLPRNVSVCYASLSAVSLAPQTRRIPSPIKSDPMQPIETLAKQLTQYNNVEVLHLENSYWPSIHPLSASCGNETSCIGGVRTYMRIDRSMMFARSIHQGAVLARNELRNQYPSSRILFLHLRVESDWMRTNFAGCPVTNESTIMSKIAYSVAHPEHAAQFGRCGSEPPKSGDVLYIAGGLVSDRVISAARKMFKAVYTAHDFPQLKYIVTRNDSSFLYELNLFGAAVDFQMGVLSDGVIGCGCSTFSFEVVLLQNMGKGQHRAMFTYTSPTDTKSLVPFFCDPWLVGSRFEFDPWRIGSAVE
jgi:hypothetical protein